MRAEYVPTSMLSRAMYLAPTPLLPNPPSLTLQGLKYVFNSALFSSPEHFAEKEGIDPLGGDEMVKSYVHPWRAQAPLKLVTFHFGRPCWADTTADNAEVARRADARSELSMTEIRVLRNELKMSWAKDEFDGKTWRRYDCGEGLSVRKGITWSYSWEYTIFMTSAGK